MNRSNEEVIILQNLSKVYKLYRSRKDRLIEWLLPVNTKRHIAHFALQDINLSVRKGEVVGLIGKNGSGKSTLLKILTEVITPTSGTFTCKGSVTALLELGAGFNKELTGIENLFYLGAIQGIPPNEMEAKIEDILAFAEIGEYAWQPVNSYSSGMYVRLAFSLAIHIDPEILIIDEALSVGDIRFQQKCFRKIRQFKDQGKTIIFCSHSMQAIRDFCTKTVWIHAGRIKEIGHPEVVTEHYNVFMMTGREVTMNKKDGTPTINIFNTQQLPLFLQQLPWIDLSMAEQFGKRSASIQSISVQDSALNVLSLTECDRKITVSILIKTEVPLTGDILISINNAFGQKITQITSSLFGINPTLTPEKLQWVQSQITLPKLSAGPYSISAGIRSLHEGQWVVQHYIHDVLFFTIESKDPRYHTNAHVVIEEIIFTTKEV